MLNAAEGPRNSVATGAAYYDDMAVVYCGLVAEDLVGFDLSQYFYPAAKFMDEALRDPQSKIVRGNGSKCDGPQSISKYFTILLAREKKKVI